MLAIDTNILVRFLTGDDLDQSRKARALIESEDVFVPTTVLLETEWVLRSAYDLPAEKVADRLAAVAGLPRVTLEEPACVAQALAWVQSGMDFADALHLSKTESCEAMVSFDRRFARVAAKVGAIEVRIP
jgi:predicted nucleic-acid-binding protein